MHLSTAGRTVAEVLCRRPPFNRSGSADEPDQKLILWGTNRTYAGCLRLCQLKGLFLWCRSTTGVVHVVTGLAVGCRVEPGHEFPVGGAGGSEFAIAFVELEPQAGDLLVQIGDLVIKHVDVGGSA